MTAGTRVPLEALIFDVDGTLAETEELHREAFNAVFREAGLDWTWDRRLYGDLLRVTGGKERIRHYVDAVLRKSVTDDTDALIARLHRRKTALYGELIAGGSAALRPGVGELIAAARAAGIRLAIATTTSRPNVTALLDATLGAGREAVFEVIVAGDEVAAKKPAPDVYLKVLRRLRLPSRCALAIEDSANGLRSAVAAGLPVLVTKGVYTAADPFDGAACVVDDLTALVASMAAESARDASVLDAVKVVHERVNAGTQGTMERPLE